MIEHSHALVVGGSCQVFDGNGDVGPCFIFAHPNETSRHIARNGIFERDLIEWSKQFCSPDKDFLDIGAHAGTYALTLAPLCRRVYAFEAQRMTYYQLCGGIALNGYTNVDAIHVALGADVGRVRLHITSEDGGGSTLSPDVPPLQGRPVIRTEVCSVMQLDRFGGGDGLVGDLTRVGFIKIDVEGGELNVLRGAVSTLRANNCPPILFEMWPDEWFAEDRAMLIEFLDWLGYKIEPAPNSSNMFLARRT